VHRSVGTVLMVGAVLAGLAPGGGLAGALGHAPLALALVALAARLWVQPRTVETSLPQGPLEV
jgi:hypothetical protein